MARNGLYTIKATAEFLSVLEKRGYACIQVADGGLGLGNFICVAPNENFYHFIINEVYMNEWSSAQTIRAQAKLSQKNLKILADLGYAP